MNRENGNIDVVLVGGGLANTLIALALHETRPDLRLVILERGDKLGGNHTWSFHTTDVTPEQYRSIDHLITARWPRQEVVFGSHARVIETGYNSIFSERLHAAAMQRLGPSVHLGAQVTDISPTDVTLADGRNFAAPLVIDGRGQRPSRSLALGYQKFVGLEVETVAPHGQSHPIIMDATVVQFDGYRFVYTLPYSPTSILIEDTYYSDTPNLDATLLEGRIEAYATARGWTVARITRRETGVLPIALAGRIDEHWRDLGGAIPRAGLRAWLFHATTGYSLPNALRLADAIAAAPELKSAAIAALVERQSRENWHKQRLFRTLNRCLFLAAAPADRVRVLEQFYRLSRGTIEHFYAGRLSSSDILGLMAIMAANPPVSIRRALGAISEKPAWRFAQQHAGGGTELV